MFSTIKNGEIPNNDEGLLKLILDPSTSEYGFKILMTTYQERLYHTIYKIVLSHENTDDVLQNTFIKVFRSLKNFQFKSSLYTWMHRIAVNEALTFRRSMVMSAKVIPLDGVSVPHVEGVDTEDLLRKLESAINTLPEKQKEVFTLRYYDEMSYESMSQLLGTSVGALKASFHHAIKKVENLITK